MLLRFMTKRRSIYLNVRFDRHRDSFLWLHRPGRIAFGPAHRARKCGNYAAPSLRVTAKSQSRLDVPAALIGGFPWLEGRMKVSACRLAEWLLLHADAVQDRTGGWRVGVGKAGRVGQAGDVGLQQRERWWRHQVGGALHEVVAVGDAAPSQHDAVGKKRRHLQTEDRGGVGRVGARQPLLPVVHAVVVRSEERRGGEERRSRWVAY